jgi:hypothetical protein
MGALPFSNAVRKLRIPESSAKQIKERTNHRNIPIIIPVLRYIPHPWQRLVPTLFYDLQIAYLNTRYCKIWDLVFDCDGCALLDVEFYNHHLMRMWNGCG